jgi:hypothetical protein
MVQGGIEPGSELALGTQLSQLVKYGNKKNKK